MMRLIGILSIHGLLSLSYLNIFISTTLFPVVSAYQINEGCDKELEVLSKCTQEKCYTDLDDYLPDSDITCDSYEYTDLCNLKYDCADCGEFFQALKDCALPNCPDCEDLKCFTENIEVNSCVQKEFFTCQECFAYFEGTDPNQPSCDDIPSLCQASRCCDSCAVVIQASMDCSWGPTCSTNDAESIECASIPPVSAPLPPDDDNGNFFFTDDSLSGSDCNQELTALNECNLASSCSETYYSYTSQCGDPTHKNLCYIDSICPDCTTAFQAFKECALPDCKECTELEECYREGSDLLNCLDDNPSCEDKCFAFLQPIVPFYGYGFCYEAPYLCMASSCCESCTTEFEEVTKCGNTFCDYSDCDDVLPVCSQEYGELYQCTFQSGCFLSSLPALFETTCDNSGFRELCLIGSVCDNCVEAYQAVNECALAGCPGCAELECFTEEVELNNCVNRDFFCATNLGYYSERCEYLPEICRESRSCEGCATEYENYVNCAYAPACAISGDSINCDDIPDPDDDFFGNDDGSFGGDNTTFGDDFFGNNDDTFGDDGVSLECQDLATEFLKCFSINFLCLFTSPKCIELGVISEDGGSGDETEDEFTCEGVPQACAEFTCCETCADSARNYIECEANEYNCSETCDDEINTLPGEGDGIVGGTISSSPIAPVPISLAPVTPEPVTPASVTPLPSTSAPVTPKPVTPAPVTPLPSTSAPVTTEPIATPSITPNTSPPTMADQPVNKTEVEKENIVTSFNNLDNWVRNIIIGSCAIVGALILFVCVRSCSDSA